MKELKFTAQVFNNSSLFVADLGIFQLISQEESFSECKEETKIDRSHF